MGFVIDRIDILGEGRLRENDVRIALGVNTGDYLFDLDVQAAQERVEALNWVDRAVVRRLWPDQVAVQIIERRPYALWQHNGVVQLVDYSGTVIANVAPQDYPNLTLVVGPEGSKHLDTVRLIKAKVPEIANTSSAFVRTSSGRWDVHVNRGRLKILLPQHDIDVALGQLQQLQLRQNILDRNLSALDLRLRDRIIFKPMQGEPA